MFIIKNDHKGVFRFASLQSKIARELLGNEYPADKEFETIYYYENGRLFNRSSAALRIARKLKFPWYLLYVLIIIPPFIRNFFYRIISRNRYRWFGKKDQCMVPSPELKSKFLDD